MRPEKKVNILYGGFLTSLLLPVLVLLAAFALSGIAPFGENTLLCESNREWFSAAAHFHSALYGEGSVLYSFADNLGGDFYSTLCGWLFSPFNLLFGLFPLSALPQAFVVATLARAAFAGLFSFILLQKFCRYQPLAASALACAYASGSMFALSFSAPQFADAAVFLPLVSFAAVTLCEDRSVLPLFCSATLFLLTCSSLWPCLILFTLAYFVWYQLMHLNSEGLWGKLGLMLICLALAFGASLAVLLPPFIVDMELGSAFAALSDIQSVSFFDMLGSLMPGSSVSASGNAFLFCSALVALLLPLYFLDSEFTLAERQTGFAFIVFLIVSVCVPAMTLIWTGFSDGVGSSYAVCVVLCIIMVSAAARLLSSPRRLKVSRVLIAWIICVVILLSAVLFGRSMSAAEAIIFAAGFLTMYAAITIIGLSGREPNEGFCIILTLCIACECAIGGMISISSAGEQLSMLTMTEYRAVLASSDTLDAVINGSESTDGSSAFFRTRGLDSAARYDIGGGESASPACSSLVKVLGIDGKNGFTPVTDSVFGVKYSVSENEQYSFYPNVGTVGQSTVFRNNAALGIGFAADSSVLSLSAYSANPFEAQNELMTAIAGADRELFINASITEREGIGANITETLTGAEIIRYENEGMVRFSVLIPSDGVLYMYAGGESGHTETISANGVHERIMHLGAIEPVGNFRRGDIVSVAMSVTDERLSVNGIYFAVLDRTLYEASVSVLGERRLSYLSVDGNTVRGSITLSDGQLLMTSIPYQSGWRAYVDGVEAEVYPAAGALLAVRMGEGEHLVQLEYHPADLSLTVVISVILGVLGFAFMLAIDVRRRRAENELFEEAIEPAYDESMVMPEDIFNVYEYYMIPDAESLDDHPEDFDDYFNGM